MTASHHSKCNAKPPAASRMANSRTSKISATSPPSRTPRQHYRLPLPMAQNANIPIWRHPP
jgi:hypothetical protein